MFLQDTAALNKDHNMDNNESQPAKSRIPTGLNSLMYSAVGSISYTADATF